MSVWLTIPSARPIDEAAPVLRLWHAMGYRIALWRDNPAPADLERLHANHVAVGTYPGYARAVNALVHTVALIDAAADWFVIGGDDILPDPSKSAEEIARECRTHFRSLTGATDPAAVSSHAAYSQWDKKETYGVMQPTGDPWGDRRGPYIERVAGSAWIGREFALKAYGGKGPLFAGYRHMYVDEELQAVAQSMRVYWQRPDLTQHHQHWGRKPTATAADIPPHLTQWNTPEHWNESRALFESRKVAGFPGA